MKGFFVSRYLAVTAGVGLLASPAAADNTNLSYLELSAGAGYSSSPFLRPGGSGAGFGNVSARGVHQWADERSSAELIGYLEGAAYTNGYSATSLASVRAQATHSASERLSISGSVGFSADYSGQLSNRFIYAPQPGAPIPVNTPVQNPDLYFYTGRQYRLDADVGATWQASERSRLHVNTGVDHVAFSNSSLHGYTLAYLSAGYDRLLSQRTTVGFQVTGSRTDFTRSDDVTTIINPAATISTRLSEDWTLSGSAGVMFSSLDRGSRQISSSTDPSFSATLCHQNKSQSLCATAARAISSSAAAELVNSTTFELQWLKKLDARQNLQLSAGYVRFDNSKIGQASLASQEYHAAATYSRLLSHRCSVGGDVGVRGFEQQGGGHHTDFRASVFVRYRLGDLG